MATFEERTEWLHCTSSTSTSHLSSCNDWECTYEHSIRLQIGRVFTIYYLTETFTQPRCRYKNNSEWNWRLKDHIHVHTSLWDLLVFDFPWLFCRTLLQASRGELRCSGSCSRLRSAGEWVEPLHQGLQKSRGEKKSRGGGKRGKKRTGKEGWAATEWTQEFDVVEEHIKLQKWQKGN